MPCICKKRKRALLLRYATIARLVEAMEKDGWKIKGLPEKVVEALRKAVTEVSSFGVEPEAASNGADES